MKACRERVTGSRLRTHQLPGHLSPQALKASEAGALLALSTGRGDWGGQSCLPCPLAEPWAVHASPSFSGFLVLGSHPELKLPALAGCWGLLASVLTPDPLSLLCPREGVWSWGGRGPPGGGYLQANKGPQPYFPFPPAWSPCVLRLGAAEPGRARGLSRLFWGLHCPSVEQGRRLACTGLGWPGLPWPVCGQLGHGGR